MLDRGPEKKLRGVVNRRFVFWPPEDIVRKIEQLAKLESGYQNGSAIIAGHRQNIVNG